MSGEKQETIADIVYMLRANARGDRFDDFSFTSLADRIEAAVNRESTCEKSSQVGNAEAMREALEQAKRVLHCAIVADILKGEDARKAFNAVTAALSAPPRNCDVGTAEEQSARFDNQCRKHIGCLTCPFRAKDGSVHNLCEFAWAQMPYEEVK